MKENRAYGYLALVATSFFWGTTWVASKIGVMEIPALQMAYIRQFLAGSILVGFFLLYKKYPLPTAKQFGWLTMMAILMFVFANGLSTWSLKWIPSGLSALIGALYPLSVVILQRLFFGGKPLTRLAYTGLLLGAGGCRYRILRKCHCKQRRCYLDRRGIIYNCYAKLELGNYFFGSQ